VAMPGGTDRHEAIGDRLRFLLHLKLEGKPCRSRGPTLKVEVQGRTATRTPSWSAPLANHQRRS
jgi:hypothetical protein